MNNWTHFFDNDIIWDVLIEHTRMLYCLLSCYFWNDVGIIFKQRAYYSPVYFDWITTKNRTNRKFLALRLYSCWKWYLYLLLDLQLTGFAIMLYCRDLTIRIETSMLLDDKPKLINPKIFKDKESTLKSNCSHWTLQRYCVVYQCETMNSYVARRCLPFTIDSIIQKTHFQRNRNTISSKSQIFIYSHFVFSM